MKKLMTMIAAVATAFGLYAAVDPADTGTSFEGATAGQTLDSQKDVIQELPGFAATALTYWANLDDTAVIKAFDGDAPDPKDRPTQFTGSDVNDRYLALSTGSKVIERYAKDAGATTDIMDGALYFDSMVKMTVFDSDPEITATGAKLKIWLQEDLDAQGNPTATNLFVNGYNCGDAETLADTWVRVTARALKISSTQIGFIVYVKGKVVATDDTVAGLPTVYVDDNVAEYGENGQLFPSLTASTEITGAGFAGMGSIDDLVFTKTAPSFVKDYEFYTIAANEHVTTFTANGQTWTSGNPLKFLFENAGQVSVTAIAYANGYFGNTTTNLDVSAAGAYFVGDAQEANVEVTINGVKKQYATMAAAMAAAQGENATIALLKDYNASAETLEINNADNTTILDLAGKKLTGSLTAATDLIVTNSIETIGDDGKYLGQISGTVAGANFAVYGGFFGDELSSTVVDGGLLYGGQFAVNPDDMADLNNVVVADGYEAVKLGSDAFWTVRLIPNYVVQINDDESKKYETLAAAVAAAQSGDTIALLKEYSFDSNTETVLFPNGVTFDLAGQTLTVAAAKQKFGTAANATVTLTDSATTKGKLVINSADYGFSVMGGSVLNVGACCIEEIDAGHPVFDIYGATVNCGADANIKGASDIFRFKDDGLTSTVNVTGGTYVSTESGDEGDKLRCIFHHYKAGHTANINITGGAFTFNNYLIDAYQQSGKDAPFLNFTPLGANNAARFSKQVLVSDQAGSIITEACVLAADCKVVKDGDTDWYKVAAIQYATVEIATVANCTIAVTNGETEVKTGATFDIDDAVKLDVYRVPAEGYKLVDGCLPHEEIMLSEAKTYSITAAVEQDQQTWPDPQTIDPTTKASELLTFPDGSDMGLANAKKLATWALKNNVAFDGATVAAERDAFLLDCAPDATETINARKAAFKVASITQGDDTWVITVKSEDGQSEKAVGAEYYNGVIQKIEFTGITAEDGEFFKARLVPGVAAE